MVSRGQGAGSCWKKGRFAETTTTTTTTTATMKEIGHKSSLFPQDNLYEGNWS